VALRQPPDIGSNTLAPLALVRGRAPPAVAPGRIGR